MKCIVTSVCAVMLAVPAFADAEDYGEARLALHGSNATVATLSLAVDKLSGDRVDNQITQGANEIVSRDDGSISAGHLRMASEMGIDASEFSMSEIAAMYFAEYD